MLLVVLNDPSLFVIKKPLMQLELVQVSKESVFLQPEIIHSIDSISVET